MKKFDNWHEVAEYIIELENTVDIQEKTIKILKNKIALLERLIEYKIY